MAQFFSTIGRHLECAIQTELVVELELALIERKQYPISNILDNHNHQTRQHNVWYCVQDPTTETGNVYKQHLLIGTRVLLNGIHGSPYQD